MAEPAEKLAEGTLISHLLELRGRLVHAFIAIILVFIPAAFFRNEIFEHLARPLVEQLPKGSTMIATSVMSPFIAPFKLAFFFSIFVAMPYVLYQVWAFVAPGLYRKEKRFAVPLLVSSILLFYTGALFAYRFVFPTMFHFLATRSPTSVQMSPDINSYLDFAMTTFLAFVVGSSGFVLSGGCAQTPIVPSPKTKRVRKKLLMVLIFDIAVKLQHPAESFIQIQ